MGRTDDRVRFSTGGRVRRFRIAQRWSAVGIIAIAAQPFSDAEAAQQPTSPRSSVTGAAVRSVARRYRESHEAEIAREFSELLAIPNVASDDANIRRNAAALIE